MAHHLRLVWLFSLRFVYNLQLDPNLNQSKNVDDFSSPMRWTLVGGLQVPLEVVEALSNLGVWTCYFPSTLEGDQSLLQGSSSKIIDRNLHHYRGTYQLSLKRLDLSKKTFSRKFREDWLLSFYVYYNLQLSKDAVKSLNLYLFQINNYITIDVIQMIQRQAIKRLYEIIND